MSLVETDDAVDILYAAQPARLAPTAAPIRVSGKFFFAGERKHFVKGVTYGPFPTASHGAPFPEAAIVDNDFALMAEAGINTVRVFTVPPVWLLDAAQEAGLRVLVGAALAAARHLSRQSGDPGGDQGSGRRRGARLRAASGDFRLSRRQRDPAGHDPLARRRAGTAVSARARRLGQERAPGGARQLRQFPVDRIPDRRFHRFSLLQRLSP